MNKVQFCRSLTLPIRVSNSRIHSPFFRSNVDPCSSTQPTTVKTRYRMQNSEEKLCLKWNDFQENLNSSFGVLRNDQDFADVTLVCEDGSQITTHKVILASSSPFFMEMLKRNKHPIIYMRGLKAEDLVDMVDFVNYGKANVDQERLDVFLGLAEEFGLRGLTSLSTESKPEE